MRAALVIRVCVLLGAGSSLPGDGAGNFGDLSIEELMNESVRSVSKKEIRLSESPEAITLITQDDIRRQGFTSIPEALRMVPGLDVARATSNVWSVSARGFNGPHPNRLLVMIDGRSVCTQEAYAMQFTSA